MCTYECVHVLILGGCTVGTEHGSWGSQHLSHSEPPELCVWSPSLTVLLLWLRVSVHTGCGLGPCQRDPPVSPRWSQSQQVPPEVR